MTQKNSPAAIELAQRRKTGKAGPLLADELRPHTFAQAFDLQQEVGLNFAGVSANDVAGWKCGLPNEDNNIIGALYSQTLQYASDDNVSVCTLYANADGLAAVEPELAFELKHDLPARAALYSEGEIDAAIGTTRLALELIQSRYENPGQATFFDALADGLVNQGVWLGPELSRKSECNLAAFLLSIQYPDGQVETREVKHPNGNPRVGLYWLVNFLSIQGIGMRHGQQAITGSYAGVLKLPMSQILTLGYGELGKFSIQFENK